MGEKHAGLQPKRKMKGRERGERVHSSVSPPGSPDNYRSDEQRKQQKHTKQQPQQYGAVLL